jgi:hypothetical protein
MLINKSSLHEEGFPRDFAWQVIQWEEIKMMVIMQGFYVDVERHGLDLIYFFFRSYPMGGNK